MDTALHNIFVLKLVNSDTKGTQKMGKIYSEEFKKHADVYL